MALRVTSDGDFYLSFFRHEEVLICSSSKERAFYFDFFNFLFYILPPEDYEDLNILIQWGKNKEVSIKFIFPFIQFYLDIQKS